MDAREYLSQIKYLRSEIDYKRNQLIDKKYNTIMGGITGDAVRVQTSPRFNAPYEDKVIEIADLERQVEIAIANYQHVVHEAIGVIHKISHSETLVKVKDKTTYIDVICDKWILGESLEQIAVKRNRSFDNVRYIYWMGMRAVQEVLDKADIQAS